MRVPFSLFLAIKYLKPKRSLVSVITVLTMLGITLGVGVLIVVQAVMTGFDDEHKKQMIKLDSHIKIDAYGGQAFDPEPVESCLEEIAEVTVVAPAVEGFVMMSRNGQPVTALLRGIDPEREKKIRDVKSLLVAGAFNLDDESVVIGDRLAMTLGVQVGDLLTVYSPECFVSEDELRLPQEVVVSGIFSIGMYEIDSRLMISSLSTARGTFNLQGGVQSLRVMTTDPYLVGEVSRKIEDHFLVKANKNKALRWFSRLRTETWMEAHQLLLSQLQTEKNMMFLLLCMISLVATMSITNTLITLCVQKTHEIGLLKALGFSSRSVVGTFLLLGSVQGFLGCFFGLVFGLSVAFNIDAILNFLRRFNPSLLAPEFYQFSEMPSHPTWADSIIICAIVMAFSTLAAVLPAWRAARMEPVDALRYE